MHEPAARIVGLESDDDEAIGREENDVSAGRVVQVELDFGGVVVLMFLLLEDGKVMAVEMDLFHGYKFFKRTEKGTRHLQDLYLRDARRT